MYSDFLSFPEDFVWGVSTAAYQIEGGAGEDGKGVSIWDSFAHRPENIADRRTGDRACDSYHKWREDAELMKTLHIKNHRMSLAWTRIFPDGTKASRNQKGIDFYDRMIDGMLENGVTPWITLFHWDLPQALQDAGGWTNQNTADCFLDYTDVVTRKYGDRVKNWMTFNEPWVYSFCGHLYGCHAPGLKDIGIALKTAHALMLSHARAVPVIHGNVSGAQAGIVHNLALIESATERPEDIAAADRWECAFNAWFLDPLFKGAYPESMVQWYVRKGVMPDVSPDDMKLIASQPGDFLGINYYTRRLVAFDPSDSHIQAKQVYRPCIKRAEFEEWEVNPEALYYLLRKVHALAGTMPVYITENGTTIPDEHPGNDGCVHDAQRIEYLRRHFAAVWQAVQEKIPVKGFFLWSLLDNFEWGFGFTKRFGIVYTDYNNNERRIVKDSARFVSDVCLRNGVEID